MCNMKGKFLGKHVSLFFFFLKLCHIHDIYIFKVYIVIIGYVQQLNTLKFHNFSLGNSLDCKMGPYEKTYCNNYPRKTQIMPFSLFSGPATLPGGASAGPGGLSIFMGMPFL